MNPKPETQNPKLETGNPKLETQNPELKILLVEDNPGDVELIREMLARTGPISFSIESVQRLSEAVSRLQHDHIDLVLLDLGLPDSVGLATFTRLHAATPDLPIIVLSGNTDQQTAVAALKEGAQDFLIKGESSGDVIVRSIRYALERKRVEQRLLASEGKYRELYESMQDAFVRVDMAGRIVEFNKSFLALLGYSGEELARRTYPDITPEHWHAMEADIIEKQVLPRGYSEVYEKEYQRKDGSIVPIEIRTNLLVDEAGAPSGMWAIIRDISEHKRAERMLQESLGKLTQILNSTAEGIYGLDASGNCTFCNPASVKILGYSGGHDLLGKNLLDLVHHIRPNEAPGSDAECIVSRSLRTGEILQSDRELLWRANGSSVPVEYWTHPILKDGVVQGMVVSFVERTEQTKLEEQLRQSQKMEALGTLAGGIAHDFNNILSAIIGYGHVTLMHMAQDDPHRLNIEHILESADRAAALTQSLLAFSRKQIIDKKTIDLNQALKRVEKFLVRVIGEDVTVRMSLEEEPLTVVADGSQLEQVLINLATNARDAMPKGGAFTIKTSIVALDKVFMAAHGYGKVGKYALIQVIDTGVGMDEKTRRRIFDPFFTTKEVGKGTGLGLAMVYGIIKQHDGFINVYSEPGMGTTFRIYLPLAKGAAAQEQEKNELAPEYPKGGTETILLAEDDETVRTLSRTVLQSSGYTVIEAHDGEDAVQKFAEAKDAIDLLLFDLIMPKKNGKDAFDAIRKLKSGIKVIFVSGYAPDIIQLKAPLEDGAHLLSKPIVPMVLLKTIREVLDGK